GTKETKCMIHFSLLGNIYFLRLFFFADLDQIYEDVANPEKANTKLDDPDTAGFGRHYCIPCARYFVSEKALAVHSETKQHKRRLKMFEKEPTAYTGPNVVIDNGLRKPADKVVDLAALAASDPLSLPSSSAGSSLDSALLDDIAKM
ncbi:MAG: hypothetical protein Q8M03_04305, partial [Legionella sp.]|nr:hypothetical protein [Legionella sp.]